MAADNLDLTPSADAIPWGDDPSFDPLDLLAESDSETALSEALAMLRIYRDMTRRLLVANAKQTTTIQRLTERLRELTRRG